VEQVALGEPSSAPKRVLGLVENLAKAVRGVSKAKT
jgi:hypothetical protein